MRGLVARGLLGPSRMMTVTDAIGVLLADHHREIEEACDQLRAGVYTDDPIELILHYRAFERAVLDHLLAEEASILPAYQASDPVDAAAIRATHHELRLQLYRIALDVELHCVRAEALEQLVTTLRAHAAHEDRGMYPWAQAHLPHRTRRDLFERIAHAIRARGGRDGTVVHRAVVP